MGIINFRQDCKVMFSQQLPFFHFYQISSTEKHMINYSRTDVIRDKWSPCPSFFSHFCVHTAKDFNNRVKKLLFYPSSITGTVEQNYCGIQMHNSSPVRHLNSPISLSYDFTEMTKQSQMVSCYSTHITACILWFQWWLHTCVSSSNCKKDWTVVKFALLSCSSY